MNNDNDLNLHSTTKLSGWLRYCSKCCKVGLSKLKIRMNLENESILFQNEGMIFGIDHHLLFFYVSF